MVTFSVAGVEIDST